LGISLLQIHYMLKRKFRTFMKILREGGIPGLYRYIFRGVLEKTGTMDGCTFGTRGIEVEGLRTDVIFGLFEKFERNAVQRFVLPTLPVVELGGCMGIVSCITNRRLANPSAHVVVEANPKVIPLLRRNRRRNRCRFEVVNRAIAYGTETIQYAPAADFAGNSLAEKSGTSMVRVKTTGLKEILNRRGFESYTLICDIEGHECELVEREAELVGRAETIILETHARLVGEEKNAAMLARLEQLGFTVVAHESYVMVLKKQAEAVVA
jgi:FkbM family methyltransferase